MKNNKGFSLVEIILLSLIAITLLTLFIGLAINSKEFVRTMECVSNMKNISQAVENFQADFKTTPANIADLYPAYITNIRVLKCPADKTVSTNSYDDFYIGRFIAEEDANKIFLACPRHYDKKKTVAAYLSYAVDISVNKKVSWSGISAKYGEIYTGGTLSFSDGTTIHINSGQVGFLSSFINNEDKLYSVVYTFDGAESSLLVNHQGDSRLEIITPALIVGVEGTLFGVRNWITDGKAFSSVNVSDGTVTVEDRGQDIKATVIKPNEFISVAIAIPDNKYHASGYLLHKRIPRKPAIVKR